MLEVISVVDYFGRIHARAGWAFAEGICVADTFSIFRSQPYLLTPASSVYSTDFCHPTKAGPLGAAPWRHRCGAIQPWARRLCAAPVQWGLDQRVWHRGGGAGAVYVVSILAPSLCPLGIFLERFADQCQVSWLLAIAWPASPYAYAVHAYASRSRVSEPGPERWAGARLQHMLASARSQRAGASREARQAGRAGRVGHGPWDAGGRGGGEGRSAQSAAWTRRTSSAMLGRAWGNSGRFAVA